MKIPLPKRKLQFFVFFLLSATSVVFFGTVSLKAQIVDENLPYRQGLKWHDFRLHAGLTGRAVYDSNIFLTDKDEEDDLIFYITPSIGLEVPLRQHLFAVEYEIMPAFFMDHTDENHTDHRLMGLAEFDFTNHKITFEDVYNRFTNRAGLDDDGVADVQLEEETNEFEANLSSSRDKFEYSLSYQNLYRQFLNGEEPLFETMIYHDRDYLTHIIDGEVGYRVQSKTMALFQARGGRITYDSEGNLVPDSYFLALMPGMRNESINHTIIEFRVGPWFQDYGDSNLVKNNDHNDVVANASVKYSHTPDDVFRINFERVVDESLYADVNYSVADFVGLEYTHKFDNKIMLIPYVSWQNRRYAHETTEDSVTLRRDDDIYALGIRGRWDLREWLSTEAGYEYRHRDSNFPTFDFDDHQIFLRGTIGV